MPDHIAVELEALAYALSRETYAPARVLFADHLRRWLPRLCRAVAHETASSPFYRALADTTDAWTGALQSLVETLVGPAHDRRRRRGERGGAPAGPGTVLVCSDTSGTPPAALSPEMVAPGCASCPRGEGARGPRSLRPVVGLARHRGRPGTGRVVVGCRQGRAQGADHRAPCAGRGPPGRCAGRRPVSRRPGRPPTMSPSSPSPGWRPAVARVDCAGTCCAGHERARHRAPAASSRRDLFGVGHPARRPWPAGPASAAVAAGRAGRAEACPRPGIVGAGRGIASTSATCTGCGACVSACHRGRCRSSGAALAGLEAAAASSSTTPAGSAWAWPSCARAPPKSPGGDGGWPLRYRR